ncbi:hypothetical protein GPECTOR_26g532 [Gonium pectorale]|uniref:Uncharacterized protein n=1 Tax=Gonium pectorale TaxID=33097 RepID=A0A150GFL7_GONPE|nr:hypothetical protein GPECTOR_26g532 [Gonium pectorale]|eukprot:KXZ48629.1 hypothetical protein GPECTOR_26g532 [Gonium pectorale]
MSRQCCRSIRAQGFHWIVVREVQAGLEVLLSGPQHGSGAVVAVLDAMAASDLTTLERQLTNLLASTSTSTTTALYDQIAKARAATDAAGAAATSASGGAATTAAIHPGTGRPLLHPPPPQSWSSSVLGSFSLALGTVLSLDHNQLGDAGARILAAGIRRLKYLNLSHNPLCAAGVTALAGALVHAAALKVVLLAAVDLGAEAADVGALAALADCLAANTSITQLDLDGNHIGDAGVSALLPFLQSQKHLRKLRLSPRVSRPLLLAAAEAVRANLPAKKKKVLKKKKGPGAR